MAAPTLAVTTDEGLLLPVRPASKGFVVFLGLGALLLGTVTVLLLVRGIGFQEWRGLAGVLFTAVGTFVFAGMGIGLLRQDKHTGLLLTPTEVRLLSDRDQPVSIPWQGITRVEVTGPLVEESDEKQARWLAFRLPAAPEPGFEDELRVMSGSPYPSLNGDDLAVGVETAADVCRFYLMRPEDRAELTTPAAVGRVSALSGN